MKIGRIEIDDQAPIDLDIGCQAFASLEDEMQYHEGLRPDGIVGQMEMIRFVLTAVLSGGHVLLEGNPGLAKTETCKRLASLLGELQFNRVQFVPDMMPSDLLGAMRIDFVDERTKQEWVDGPIFTNLLLADEINRASAKVQAALLEATGERQVSMAGRKTKPLRTSDEVGELLKLVGASKRYFGKSVKVTDRSPLVFSVTATMNPIEMEGTFALSEAQLDRFMAKVLVPYPDLDELELIQKHKKTDGGRPEFDIAIVLYLSHLRELLVGREAKRLFMERYPDMARQIRWLVWFSHARPLGGGMEEAGGWATEGGDLAASEQARSVRMKLKEWARGSAATQAAEHEFAGNLLEALAGDAYPGVVSGSSPRGMERLTEALLVTAFLNGHVSGNEVEPTQADLDAVVRPILRHRIRLSSSAMAGGRNSDEVVTSLLQAVRAAFNPQG